MAAEGLRVTLGNVPVGSLSRNVDGRVEFRLLASYRAAYPRPTLGQQFLDDLDAVHRARGRVPPWFSNLLPEGALRGLIAHQLGVPPTHELSLLRHLGKDLPGAVRIEDDPSEPVPDVDELHLTSTESTEGEGWHFSLAGVQLKFSARADGKGMTVPVGGIDGDWIVKLPDHRYAGVPANEFATMQWARASGISVPETRLVDLSQISGLPPSIGPTQERRAYAIRRFDRGSEGQRIHIEDFAQVLDLYPEDKYRHHNYETIANLVLALSGEEDLIELIRRYVFMVASGNGDAHHKNWSLIYPDGLRARLAPAYDLVSTIQYLPEDRLALNLARSKQWSDVTIYTFERMARKLHFDEARMISMVRDSVDCIQAAWAVGRRDFGYSSASIERLNRHMSAVPLLN